jgi:peptide-methionine (S)-S-oxide reductase
MVMSKDGRVTEIAVFGGGCFWCTEAVFKMLNGVASVTPGYAGGSMDKPGYEDVSSGRTGHAEVVRIAFDPAQVAYETLLTVFFATHDPTTLNRQGSDIGTQYRSIILYTTDGQKAAAERFIADLNASAEKGRRVVTEVKPLGAPPVGGFFAAEEYHKDYYARNAAQPYCQVVINPKLKKVQEKFAALLDQQGT